MTHNESCTVAHQVLDWELLRTDVCSIWNQGGYRFVDEILMTKMSVHHKSKDGSKGSQEIQTPTMFDSCIIDMDGIFPYISTQTQTHTLTVVPGYV